jgi:hypothetical protein
MARNRLNDPVPNPLVADRLTGAGEIAECWYGVNNKNYRDQVYRLLEQRLLPAGKMQGKWIASRKRLMQFHEDLTNGNFHQNAAE